MAALAERELSPPRQARQASLLLRVIRRPMGLIGAVLVFFVVVVALLAPHLAPLNPIQQFSQGLSAQGAPLPPGGRFLLGTDDLGRDILSRLLYGSRDALEFSIIGTAAVTVIGVLFGVTAGYFGGAFDQFMMRFTDAMYAFPFLLFVIFLISVLGHTNLFELIVLISLTFWPSTARLARAETLVAKETAFVEAERSLGASPMRILVRHVIPNIMAPVVVLTTQRIGGLIGLEAALSYLGLGAPPPAPTWGAMVAEGQQYFQIAPWMFIYPGIALTLTVLGFNLLGDALNAVLNPKRGSG